MRTCLKNTVILPLWSLAVLLLAGCGGQILSAPPAVPAPTPGAAAPAPADPSIPASAITIRDIQKLGGWQSCTACTGSAFARYSMTEGITDPSLSGASARFSMLAGTQPYGGVLWFKFLTIDSNATHFVYDLYFYTDNPSAPQALEFNVSQSTGGNRYSFATQCDLTVQRAWLVWNPSDNQWVPSGVPCVQPPPDTWNHLIWEFERKTSGQVVFNAVTLNGNRSELDLAMAHTPDSSNGIDVAFQLDANHIATPYSVWLDRINLSYW